MLCGDGNIDFVQALIAFLVMCGLLVVAWHSFADSFTAAESLRVEGFQDQPKPVPVSRAEAFSGIRSNFEAERAILQKLLPYYTLIVDTAAKSISVDGTANAESANANLANAVERVEATMQQEAPGKVITVRQSLDSIKDIMARAGVPDEVKYMAAYAYLPQNIDTYGTTYDYLTGKAEQLYKNINNMSAAAPLPKIQGATAETLGVSIQAFTDCCGPYNPILEKVNDAYKSNSDKLLQEYYNISMTRRRVLGAAGLKEKEATASDIFGRLAALQRQFANADAGESASRILGGASLTSAVEGFDGGGAGLVFSN